MTSPRAAFRKAILDWYEKHLYPVHIRCALCEHTITPGEIEWDHILPYSMGGADTAENLQPTHRRCNRAKGNRL